MSKILFYCFSGLLIFLASIETMAQVDWTPSTKQGNIVMTGDSQNGFDLDILRNSVGAGIKVFNSNLTGRSLILLGQEYGGKYGYLAYHGATHVSDPGYTLTYRPESTVLTGSGSGGLGIVAKTEIRFNAGGEGDGYLKMILTSTGNLGIGTTSPDSKLSVKGTIHSQEVKVDLLGAVAPDYVFEKDYPLTSLEELRSYIDQHKHLPEIPSSKEMEENGINLKEMNLLLLKKVEELTLYLFEQNKIIHTQNERIVKLESKIQ